MTPRRVAAARTGLFTESVIREMTRLADEHGAINLAQGFPDFDAPAELKEAAALAIAKGFNQYPVTWGSPRLRHAIAEKYARFGWPDIDPETQIVVTCGSTEAMVASYLALLDPGDEIIMVEPFYENYGPDAHLSGAVPKVVRFDPPEWRLDPERLASAIGGKTRALVLTTPHNPTGRVFETEELQAVADLAIRHDLLVFTDEIYEHIVYDGRGHCSIARLPGMADRTITISALSKTYSVTGWRVGWAIASRQIVDAIRKVHDFLTVAAPAPLQEAGVAAMELPMTYYEDLRAAYDQRRSTFLDLTAASAFGMLSPEGAYYVMADVADIRRRMGIEDDVTFCRELILRAGVAAVPGSSFFVDPTAGRDWVRFAFPKRSDTLQSAAERLVGFAPRLD